MNLSDKIRPVGLGQEAKVDMLYLDEVKEAIKELNIFLKPISYYALESGFMIRNTEVLDKIKEIFGKELCE